MIQEGMLPEQQVFNIETSGLSFDQLRRGRTQLQETLGKIDKTLLLTAGGLQFMDGNVIVIQPLEDGQFSVAGLWNFGGNVIPIGSQLPRYGSYEEAMDRVKELAKKYGYRIVTE